MPRTYRVIVLPEAFDDLDRIIGHIAPDSPQNAATTLDRLWEACQSLALFPHRHRVYQHRADTAKTVHAMPQPPFMIYYRVDEARGTVRVLTVRHGARRQPRRFKK
jgi:plasmid stabilization system protein ParE